MNWEAIMLKKHLGNSNKPNILMLGPYPPPYGGIAIVVRDLINSPIKDVFNLKLLETAPQKKNKYTGEFLRVFSDITLLLNELIFDKPDIVHIHTSYDWGWPKHIIYAIISKIFGYIVILHIHAYHQQCENKFPEIWLKRFIFPPKIVLKIVDTVFTLSDKYTRHIIDSNIKTPVITIPNGILLKDFLSINIKEKNEKFVITYIGTIEKRKGIYELMGAAEKVLKKDPNINMIIAGNGPARDDLIKWHNSLKAENVCYLGAISETKKIELLATTDVFVLQSTNEGLPIALLEAMAAGCAIITTPVGSITDVIKHGINGIIIPPEDESALVEAIMRLYNNKNLLRSIQENNLKKRHKYSWEKLSNRVSAVYMKLGMEDKNG